MAVDAVGIYQYADSDKVTSWPAFMNLGMSSVSTQVKETRKNNLVYAQNYTDMTNKKNSLSSMGITGSASNPLLFYNGAEDRVYTWNGSAFKQVLDPVPRINAATAQNTRGNWSGSNSWVRFNQGTSATLTMSAPVTALKTYLITLSHSVLVKSGTGTYDGATFKASIGGQVFSERHVATWGTDNNVTNITHGPVLFTPSTSSLSVSVTGTGDSGGGTGSGFGGMIITAQNIG